MTKRILVLLSFVWVAGAHAAPPTKESIEALLEVTKASRTFDGVMDTMTRTTQQQLATAFAGRPLAPEQQQAMRDLQTKISNVVREAMSFERLEPLYVDVYRQTFTQDEIDGMIAFYRTPVGQSSIDKMPQVMQRMQVAMQPLMTETMQRVLAITKQAMSEAQGGRPAADGPAK